MLGLGGLCGCGSGSSSSPLSEAFSRILSRSCFPSDAVRWENDPHVSRSRQRSAPGRSPRVKCCIKIASGIAKSGPDATRRVKRAQAAAKSSRFPCLKLRTSQHRSTTLFSGKK